MGWSNHPAGSINALAGDPIGASWESITEKRIQAMRPKLLPQIDHLNSLLRKPEIGTDGLTLPAIPQGTREAIIRSKIADSINDFIRDTNVANRGEANDKSDKPSIITEGRLPELSPADLAHLTTGEISAISQEGKIALAMYKNDITLLFLTLTHALWKTTKEATERPDMGRFACTDHKKRAMFLFPVHVSRINSNIPTILNLPSAVTCAFDTKTGNLTLIEWGDTFDKHLHEESLRQYDEYSNKVYEIFHGETNPVKQQVEDILNKE